MQFAGVGRILQTADRPRFEHQISGWCLLIAGLVCLTAAVAQAAEPERHFPINGVGVAACADWNDRAKGAAHGNENDETMRMLQTSWAQGYLTALNSVAMVHGGADWLSGVQVAQIIRGIDSHCSAHPADQIVTAVLEVQQTLENAAAIRGRH